MKLEQLKKIYISLVEAEKLNIAKDVRKVFNSQLIDYLEEQLGVEIKISDKYDFGYIKGIYKGSEFELKTANGIILSVSCKENAELIKDFSSILNSIVGCTPICSYDFNKYNIDGTRVLCPTVEWNLDPHSRLESLIMQVKHPICQNIKNFENYYLTSLISSLGTGMFTFEGYNMIFNTSYNNLILNSYILDQIRRVYPDINMDLVYFWYNNCSEIMENSNQVVKKNNF